MSGVTAACAKQFDMLSYFLHEAYEFLAVLPKIVSANNTCFTGGFWKFMGVITWLLITSTTTELCLVLGSESCWVEMDFSTNWLIMKSIQTLENEIDPRLYDPHPVLHTYLTDFWVRKCVSVCVWVSELCVFYTVCGVSWGNPGVMLTFVNVCLHFGAAGTVNNYKNWVWQKLSVISVTIWQHAGTGPSIRRLGGTTSAVIHVCFSSWHPNTLM